MTLLRGVRGRLPAAYGCASKARTACSPRRALEKLYRRWQLQEKWRGENGVTQEGMAGVTRVHDVSRQSEQSLALPQARQKAVLGLDHKPVLPCPTLRNVDPVSERQPVRICQQRTHKPKSVFSGEDEDDWLRRCKDKIWATVGCVGGSVDPGKV